ncbi:TMEM43 family protein [Candidatus Marithioploca araucensis]|uniref:TMEM43 family protein n=1 Tax=Candidatus Marithioploca araucensis TaxID=70273 RepID=A0ABT7VT83_9GAMM|nr:TMEM43 family protein [Candidatus Marithioploca araucensis]
MSNSYTITTHQSWGSRIKESFAVAVIGIMLFFAAFPMLFLNEGRAVYRAQALEEGEKIVTPIKANNILKNNEDMLVHTSGEATTDEVLTDIILGLEAPQVIKLQRVVEMYQWEETEHSKTETELGGGTTTTYTYTYSRVWSENIINSNRFKQTATYSNPSDMSIRGEIFLAQQVKLGQFILSDNIVNQINEYRYLPTDSKTRDQVLEKISHQFGKSHFQGEYFYVAENPSSDQIGDLRIKFEVVPSTMISVVAKQVGSRLATYTTVEGQPLLLFGYGTLDAKEMFESAKRDNFILTWGLRLAGFLMMGIGLSMILNVLAILAGTLGTEKGQRLEEVFATVLSYGLKNPDIKPESIQLRQQFIDTEGLVFPKKGKFIEVDIIAENGKMTVFEVKATATIDDVDIFSMKVKLIQLQNPDKQVHGIIISPWASEEVKQCCTEYDLELLDC